MQRHVFDEAADFSELDEWAAGGPDGVIWGNHGLVESQRTWDSVKIINDSAFDLVINHIDTIDGSAVSTPSTSVHI